MKTKHILIALAALVLVGAAGAALYRTGIERGAKSAAAQEKKPLYWHDPMVPGQKFDKPGKSPFMDMQLVPVYAGEAADEGKVAISPRMQQNLGMRTAKVSSGRLESALAAVGSVAYNERDVALVQARSGGFVSRLHVRAPLDRVRKGQALLELYSPDWIAAQEDYLAARRMQGAAAEGLADASRERMRLAGMDEDHIGLVERTGKVHPRVVVTAPIGGVVAELSAREGMK
jgi:Cu(I)/Ag(I) efflux system membrane fusion protein